MDAHSDSSVVLVATSHRRRWLRPRFSLRAMFIVVTVACLIGGCRFDRSFRQRAAVKRFYELTAPRQSGATTLGYRNNGKDAYYKPIIPKWLHPLRDLIGEEAFGEVTGVQLQQTAATDDDLRYLADLPTVERINLSETKVTNEGLIQLRVCPKLRSLYLEGIPITNHGLEEISKLQTLESLSLSGTNITDEGLVHLKKFTKLKELWLRNTAITDAGFRRLQQALPGCEIQADVPAYYKQRQVPGLLQW